MQATRRARLQAVIQEELSMLISREVKDPRIPPLTITEVQMTEDGSHAVVFIAILGGAQATYDGAPPLTEAQGKKVTEDCLTGLASASGFMRKHLGKILSVRHIPTLAFKEDLGFENSLRVNQLLRKISEPDSGNL